MSVRPASSAPPGQTRVRPRGLKNRGVWERGSQQRTGEGVRAKQEQERPEAGHGYFCHCDQSLDRSNFRNNAEIPVHHGMGGPATGTAISKSVSIGADNVYMVAQQTGSKAHRPELRGFGD